MGRWRFRCPRGHTIHKFGADRAQCERCRELGVRSSFDREELLDVQDGDDVPPPPGQEHGRVTCPWPDCNGRVTGPTHTTADPGCQTCGRRPGLAPS